MEPTHIFNLIFLLIILGGNILCFCQNAKRLSEANQTPLRDAFITVGFWCAVAILSLFLLTFVLAFVVVRLL